jgi:non-lysosomal glucosylceramidase
MSEFVYKGNNTKAISFPLGGIGTGCIGLSGNGRLIDWEIYNKPNKGSINGFTHFAIKAENEKGVLDARVLNGDFLSSYTGGENAGAPSYSGFGFGPDRATMAGVPHFKDLEFRGEYPFADLSFKDEMFPGLVNMTAFNPLIPLNDKGSSIPGAFFNVEVENTTEEKLTYTVCFSVNNMLAQGTTVNKYIKEDNMNMIKLTSNSLSKKDVLYGDLTVATDAEESSYQEYWYRGSWFDALGIYWRELNKAGKFKNRSYELGPRKVNNLTLNGSDMCTLAAHFEVEPAQKKSLKFVLTWNFPNCYNFWNPESCGCGSCGCDSSKPKTWKNYYATVFEDSTSSAKYSLTNWERLFNETMKFKNALFSSTLPQAALDAVSANISILKSPTCLRLEDGSFYGFEGCHCNSGCCDGSCTHVWNYAYALPFLFPKLERSMRDLDFKYNQREDGGMAFRLQLPIGRERSSFRPCADGQFGGVIKAYRDWKISGDTEWLKKNWEAVKKSIEFAWCETNEDKWDADKNGVLEGRQHHTLDMELFGPNSWLTGFYLAALKAGAEMAEFLGEKEKAKEYHDLFLKGKEWTDKNLFNGEYYYQLIDLKDKSILEKFSKGNSLLGDSTVKAYWNEEAGEIKYQVAEGSIVDQVLAQWHANICGLGEIFDRGQTRKALKSIYKNNFKKSMRNVFNACRLYSMNDEAGVIICDWPEGRDKPVVPVTYAEETMNGFEYQVAIHMIQEGFVEEGFEIIAAIRNRYDGERRNPWNEFECGSNYARSMASFAVLPAVSGFEFNMVENMIGFNPVLKTDIGFTSFWSLDSGWGLFKKEGNEIQIEILYGKLDLNTIVLPFITDKAVETVTIGDKAVEFKKEDQHINFAEKVSINCGEVLKIKSM